MRVTILGCGGSSGVPIIGNDWGSCDPSNPKNRRTRPSILVADGPTAILVDTSPDLRQQLLAADVRSLDAVLYTHAHADHTHGIDDLRAVSWLTGRPLDVYLDAPTLAVLQTRFEYCFTTAEAAHAFHRPALVPHLIEGSLEPFRVGGIDIVPFDQDHGASHTLGFRFGGRIAYSTDVKHLDESAFAVLAGVEVWIVSSLREEPHSAHAHLDLTLSWIERVRPGRAYLTHMNYHMDYDRLRRSLPPGVEPAYDGLVIEI